MIVGSELHLFTGIFNFLFDHLNGVMKGVENSSVTAYAWSDQKSVTPDGQGGQFNGNSVQKLLSDIPSLELILSEHQMVDLCQPIIKALHAFKEVTHMCLG